MKTKSKIALSLVVASGVLFASGCNGNKATTTTTVQPTSEITSTEENKNIHKITFVTYCDLEIDPITGEYRDEITLPVPERAGYTFLGWYRDENFSDAYTSTTMPMKDITLYASWEALSYTITFKGDYTQDLSSITLKCGEAIPDLPAPSHSGYVFEGWKEEIPSVMPATDLTFTAVWRKDTYTLTFDYNDGSDPVTISMDFGAAITYPEPTREGYVFVEWKGTSHPSTMPAANLTLKAVWKAIEYSITYNADGGTLYYPVTTYTIEDSLTLPVPDKKGYTFTGWYLDLEHTKPLASIPAGTTEDIVLYAAYQVNTYTITYKLNNGNPDHTDSFVYNTAITSYTPENVEGFTFTGWSTEIPDVMPASNITVYAMWAEHTYTITYVLDGGTYDGPTQYVYGEEDIVFGDAERENYEFMGWYSDMEFTTPVTGIESGKTGNVTVYAKWQAVSYTITYELNGGEYDGKESYTVEDEFEFGIPTQKYFDFTGWYTDAALTDKVTGITKGSTGNLILYAGWSASEYTITYETYGGTYSGVTTYNYLSEVTLGTPKRKYYDFGGWYTSEEFNEEEKITKIEQYSCGDLTLYAQWIPYTYTITYEACGGTYMTSQTYTVDDEITLGTPTRTAYDFKGWYVDEAKTSQITKIEKGSPANITVYAKWEPTKYTITYYKNGGTYDGVTEYTVEDSVTFEDATKSYYDFKGWYLDSEFKTKAEDISAGSYGDVVLYAKWTATKYHITYDLNNSSAVLPDDAPIEYTVEDIPDLPTVEDFGIYIFTGWYSDFIGNTRITELPSAPHDITLYGLMDAYLTIESGVVTACKFNILEENGITEISIPSTFDGTAVTSIGGYAFSKCTSDDADSTCTANDINLTKITLPSTITMIGKKAFAGLTNLKEINIPSSVTSIGTYAFEGIGATYMTFPSGLHSLSDNLCYNCPNLRFVVLNGSISTWGSNTFKSCPSLELLSAASNKYKDIHDAYVTDMDDDTASTWIPILGSDTGGIGQHIQEVTRYDAQGNPYTDYVYYYYDRLIIKRQDTQVVIYDHMVEKDTTVTFADLSSSFENVESTEYVAGYAVSGEELTSYKVSANLTVIAVVKTKS